MQILFITTKFPLPLIDGHALRTYNLLRHAAQAHDVHLLSFVKSQEEYDYIEELRDVCSSVELIELAENKSRVAFLKTVVTSLVKRKAFVVCKYDNAKMHRMIESFLATNHIDIIHFDMLPLAVYLRDAEGYKTLLNEHNVESALLSRRVDAESNFLLKIFYSLQQKWLERFEREMATHVDRIIACSDIDKSILEQFAPGTPVVTVPNGVDTVFFSPSPELELEEKSLVFVGGLNWFPNLDALRWFDQSVLPEIIKKWPKVILHVIGTKEDVEWVHPDNIICHGRVEDVRPYMAKATLFVVPLRIGGGTRLKILNALSMGKVVVSTTIGAEGLGAIGGENIVIANEASDFAIAIDTYFQDADARKRLSQNGMSFVEGNYKWASVGAKLTKVYKELQEGRD